MPRTILIVDDIDTNRMILQKILSGDYEMLEAADGREAVALIRQHYRTLSAVLLDLAMPVMDGFEVLRQVRANPDMAAVPIIVTTGRTEENSEVEALRLGANDYVTKPYNSTIIKQRIWNTIHLRETAATINALQRDRLTGLFSREVFFDRADEQIAQQPPGYYTMTAFDVDNFKIINDQYGASKGDEVLRHVARSINRWAEETGSLCCRVMADSFAMIYRTELQQTEGISRCHHEASHPPCLDRPIRIRMGRYLVTDKALPASSMYDRATLAEATMRGRYDAYIAQYDESMRTQILREQQIVNEMKPALAGGQFEVWYQPQFNHVTGALVGAEGLVRWRHPERGLVSPAEFIPVFERNGFIYELDKFVWERVARDLRRWIDEGRSPAPVSVNVSRADLFHQDLVDVLSALVHQYRLPLGLLRLEVTESAFAQSPDTIIRVVERLIDKGFTVEIDDFGSGYSSLNTLKDVPASILKLDMKFLEAGHNSARGGNIIESVVRMAKWLGMLVIAEGVESRQQADYLKSIGCYYLQGYLYARPMELSQYEAFVRDIGVEPELLGMETVEHLDNDLFWDPKSMETLIFNSYVGGACILEHFNGRNELLRVNDNYLRELGAEAADPAGGHELELTRYMDAENQQRLNDNILRAIELGVQSSCELCLTGLNGGLPTYIRATVRVIAKAGARRLLYCTIANVTAQRLAERKEREASEQLLTMMNDMPGGFCRVQIADGVARMVYANNGFCRMVGMSREEAYSLYGGDAFRCIHPEDRSRVFAAYRDQAAHEGVFGAECRIRHGAREYLWAEVHGRLVREADGTFLNAYYTDITEHKRAEDQQKELLDNLPCGAALYRWADGRLTTLHLNRRYRELVGRRLDDLAAVDAFAPIHPDDQESVLNELYAGLRENRMILTVVRIRYGDAGEEYRLFRVSGRIMDNGDGSYNIYAAFARIKEREMSLSEAVPHLMSDILHTTTDLSFVKDRELRYVCCSRPFLRMLGLQSESEIVGKTDFDLFPEELAQKYRDDDLRLMQSNASLIDMLEAAPSPDGSPRLVQTSKYLLRDTTDRIIALYGVGRTVTRQ